MFEKVMNGVLFSSKETMYIYIRDLRYPEHQE